jgi:hypothetical protein
MLVAAADPLLPSLTDDEILDLYESAFTTFGSENCTVCAAEQFEFFAKPGLKSAKRLLTAYKIPHPLAMLVNAQKRERELKMKKESRDRALAKQKGGNLNRTVFHDLLVVDTMHDVMGVSDPDNKLYKVFNRELSQDFPREIKNLYLSSDTRFTKIASDYIRGKSGLTTPACYDMTKHIERQRLDKLILNIFKNTTNTLNIVLDNIVAGVETSQPVSEASFAFIGCAFILVLFSNLRKLGKLTQNDINIIDGDFIKMDGNYIVRFIQLFARSIKRVSQAVNVTVNINTPKQLVINQYNVPSQFNAIFATDIELSRVDYNGVQVPAIRIGQTIYKIKQKMGDYSGSSEVVYPHSKNEFRAYVAGNLSASKELWHLNLLRDAYKAEVAIELDSPFITHDRLAHLYYQMLGGQKGILLRLDHLVQFGVCL